MPQEDYNQGGGVANTSTATPFAIVQIGPILGPISLWGGLGYPAPEMWRIWATIGLLVGKCEVVAFVRVRVRVWRIIALLRLLVFGGLNVSALAVIVEVGQAFCVGGVVVCVLRDILLQRITR